MDLITRTGRITAWTSTTRLATVEGIPAPVPALRHVTSIAVGDTAVVIQQGGQAWLVGVMGVEPPPASPVVPPPSEDQDVVITPPAPPPATPVTIQLRPTFSGSYRAGAWRGDTSDLYQGDYTGRGINTGGCWWGPLPSSILSATLRLERGDAGAGAATAPTLCLLAGVARPGGAPTIRASVAGPALARGRGTDWAVPAAWISQLAAGTAGGIGCTSGGSRTPYVSLLASGVGMTLAIETLA